MENVTSSAPVQSAAKPAAVKKTPAKPAAVVSTVYNASASKTPAAALRALASHVEGIKVPVFDSKPFDAIPEAYRAAALDGARKAFNAAHGDGAQQVKTALDDGFRQIVGAFSLGGKSGAGRPSLPSFSDLSQVMQEKGRAMKKEGKDAAAIAAMIGGESGVNLASVRKALDVE